MNHGFTIYDWLPHGHEFSHIYSAVLCSIIMLVLGFIWGNAQKKKGAEAVIPEPEVTGRSFGDFVASALDGLVLQVVGQNGRRYTPIFGTVFLFIFLNNALGLIPGFLPATDNISTNFGIAILIFLMTHYIGVRTHGVSYIKHFMGPMLALAPLMLPIELISHIARPVSLSIRLFGNMYGDHMVLGIFSGLVPLLVPVIFLFLGLFVCLMQAFVFTMLSMIYIAGAESHDH